jgi:hypothetical protein
VRSPALEDEARANAATGLAPDGWRTIADVRMHADGRAAQHADALGARAFAIGRDVWFGTNEFRPGTVEGDALIRHELTHVDQQARASAGSSTVQLDTKPGKTPALTPDLEVRHGDWLIARFHVKSVQFPVTVGVAEMPRIVAAIPAIAAAIEEANARISDQAFRVATCAIASATTRFTTLAGKPVLVLDAKNADAATARHELGHATFHYLRQIPDGSKNPLRGSALAVTDIFLRLAATKPVKASKVSSDGTPSEQELPAGLWIADPPQWSGARKLPSEHPWDDADEFFASAREGYLVDRRGLEAAVARFTKLDPAVRVPAAQLLATLGALTGGKAPPKVSPGPDAAKELGRIPQAGAVEDTLDSIINDTLRWALDPTTIPGAK